MKILNIIGSMDPLTGGPCQGIRNSVPELEVLGHQNEVVSLDDPNADYIKKDNFIIHALGSIKNPWAYHPKLIPWLLKNLGRFDVVILHGLWLYPGYAVWKAINLYRQQANGSSRIHCPKFYVMPHGMLDPYFQNAPERKLKAVRNWIYWKLIENKVVNDADGLLFTCEQELILARKTFTPYRPNQELNIGFGITEPPAFTQSMKREFDLSCPGLNGQNYLLFLSRIHKKKGVELLIRAYSEIIEDSGSDKFKIPKLVIAGPGLETSYGKEIQKIVQTSFKLKDSVFLPGMLSGDAKWGAFYGCEAFVLPSHQENFGIAVVEALACGKPVLISNQVNIWWEINKEVGGIVADNSFEGIMSLIMNWQNLSIKEKKEMEKNARDTYEKYFAIESNILRFIKALNDSQVSTINIIE